MRISGGEWEKIAETVGIVRVPCRLGGARPYFICPGVANGIACGRRVAKLHGPGRYFLCRHCYRLANISQREGKADRALRRANKIRRRLGGDPGMAAPSPRRRRACDGGPMSGRVSRCSTPRRSPTKPSPSTSNACWPGATNSNVGGVSGHDRDQA